MWNSGGINAGTWSPIAYSHTSFATAVAADIGQIESMGWIDHQTALVTVEVSVWNPNNNLVNNLVFPVQFTNSGMVIPHSPFAGAANVDLSNYALVKDVFMPFIYVAYYVSCEVWGSPLSPFLDLLC